MRVLFVVLASISVTLAQEKPIELSPDEIETLASGKLIDHEPVLKKIDGKIVKLTGTISDGGGGIYRIAVSPGAKKKSLEIELTFVKDPRISQYLNTIAYNTSIGQPGRGTIYVRPQTSRTVVRPTADYKVPDNLKPRARAVPMFETPDQMQVRIQQQLIEADELEKKIMEDARKKGKVETVKIYVSHTLFKDAAPDLKYLSKEVEPKR